MTDADSEQGDVQLFFNPSCSKCRTVQSLLEERGLSIDYVRYLEQTPTRAQLERVMVQLGIDDPRAMMRTGEQRYKELGLASAGLDELLDAMVAHPILIERPIIVRGNRAVIGRPPDRALELLRAEG
jgi:arsenate reductase